jgi:hypothetical protein
MRYPIVVHKDPDSDYGVTVPDYARGVWAVISIDLSKLSDKTKRVNITLPERVFSILDKYAFRNGETRSGLFA